MSLKELIENRAPLSKFVFEVAKKYLDLDENGVALISKESLEDVKVAQEELNTLMAYSEDEKGVHTAAYNLALNEHDKEQPHVSVDMELINRMDTLLLGWKPDGYELLDIREAAYEYLNSFVHVAPSDVISQKTVDEWYAEQLEIANRRLQYVIKIYSDDIERAEEANKTMADLKKALDHANI